MLYINSIFKFILTQKEKNNSIYDKKLVSWKDITLDS